MPEPAPRRSRGAAALALLCLLTLGLWEGALRLAPATAPPVAAPAPPLPVVPSPGAEAGSLPVSRAGEPDAPPLPASALPPDPRSWERWAYVPVATDREAGPSLTARAAILVEPATMTVLYARNEHERRAPASTTKIMTALLALERGRLSDTVTVSRRAAGIRGSSVHLRAGQRVSLNDLIHGLLLRSGNDAAIAIAEHVAGSEEAFVHLMNRRARELGAANTRFQNPHGLDHPEHFSTAFDLAHLARLAMILPTFKDIVAMREYVPPTVGVPWRNTNRLLWGLEGTVGVKTGTTGQAGNCLVAAASRDGLTLISVVLHSADRWRDTRALLEWGFQSFHPVTVARREDTLVQAAVPRAAAPLRAGPAADLTVLVHDREVDDVRVETYLAPVTLPVRRGQTVGWARVRVGDEVRRDVPLVAQADVLPWTPLRALWQWLRGIVGRPVPEPQERSRAGAGHNGR